MATADYERILEERGYALVPGGLLEPVSLAGSVLGRRAPLITGRKQVGDSTVEAQLQSVTTRRSAGLAVVVRVRGTGLQGEGFLAPRGIFRGAYHAMTSGPAATVAVFWFLIFTGLFLFMLPGMLLVWLMVQGARTQAGLKPLDALAAPGAGRQRVWGRDVETARQAMPHVLQETLARAPNWFGYCEVRAGDLTLDRQFGYTRYDLFIGALDAAESAGAVCAALEKP